MKFFGSRQFVFGASLLAAFLLGLGAFLSWPADGSEAPAAHTMSGSPQVDRITNGGGHPLGGSYLVVVSEEVEDLDKAPVNAGLLTVLLLAASFAATVGWLLENGIGQREFGSWRVALHPSFITTCEDTPFLGVFRL